MPKTKNIPFENSQLSKNFICSKNKSQSLDSSVRKMAESRESVKAIDNLNQNKLPDFGEEGTKLTCNHSWSDLMEDEASSKVYILNKIINS